MRRLTVLVLMMLVMPATMAEAEVHSTSSVDKFPNDMQDPYNGISRDIYIYSENKPEDGQYVMGMVAWTHDNGISLIEHLDYQTVWATSTPTNSNASIGAPDGAYHYSPAQTLQ